MKLLKKLYLTKSPSRKEQDLSKLVQKELIKLGITDFIVDDHFQIYKLIKDTPLLCAHMDQVSFTEFTTFVKISDGIIYGNGNLGADDKNGVWILLKLLKTFKDKVSFIFSTQEEVGCKIDTIIKKEESILKTIKYGLIFDRRNGSDVIGTWNGYCVEKFEDDLKELMKKHNYETEMGTFSDCDALSSIISCINISCGYYEAHTRKEFTIIADLIKALHFGKDILKNITEKYDIPENKYEKYYHNRNYYDHLWYNNYTPSRRKRKHKSYIESLLYQCDGCMEYFEYSDLSATYRCPLCHSSVTYIEYDSIDEESFNVGDEVLILDKTDGLKLEEHPITWKRWDTGFVHSINNCFIYLSKTKDGEKEIGLFIPQDLEKVISYEEEENNDLCKCWVCSDIQLEVTMDVYDNGYIFICPSCNFNFPTTGSCISIKSLVSEYEEFIDLCSKNDDYYNQTHYPIVSL